MKASLSSAFFRPRFCCCELDGAMLILGLYDIFAMVVLEQQIVVIDGGFVFLGSQSNVFG